tara:strand:+ start:2516 stop:2617 length:102 start_codon:yes stop_codon:yes gene_type:complete
MTFEEFLLDELKVSFDTDNIDVDFVDLGFDSIK